MGIRINAKNEAVLGLRGGGQLSQAMLDHYLDNAMIRLYSDTDMLRLPVYISIVQDTTDYTVPSPSVTGIENAKHLLSTSFVSYDAADEADPQPEEIISRTPVSRQLYSMIASASSGSVAWSLRLGWKPGSSIVRGLELIHAYTSKLDDYVPAFVENDAQTAITALLRYYIQSETGKPWTDMNAAGLEFSKYLAYSGRIKISGSTDFTSRDMAASAANPFII